MAKGPFITKRGNSRKWLYLIKNLKAAILAVNQGRNFGIIYANDQCLSYDLIAENKNLEKLCRNIWP